MLRAHGMKSDQKPFSVKFMQCFIEKNQMEHVISEGFEDFFNPRLSLIIPLTSIDETEVREAIEFQIREKYK